MQNSARVIRLSIALLLAGVLFLSIDAAASWSGTHLPTQSSSLGRKTLSDQWLDRQAGPHIAEEGATKALARLRTLAHGLKTRAALPQVTTAEPLIQQMINQVESSSIYSLTGDLTGEWAAMIAGASYTITNRNTYGGSPIQHATQYVYEHFAASGLTPSYHYWSGTTNPNVIGEIPGLRRPDDIVLITSHLDDLPTAPIAPGADDNGSGSVAVLTAAQILGQHNWDCTLRFATFTGEEQGLLGSSAYANMISSDDDNVLAVLNLDMIGYNSDASPILELHTRRPPNNAGDLTIAQLFEDVVVAYSLNLSPTIVQDGLGASDHASFWSSGYSAILAIEDWSDHSPHYHLPSDRLNTLDMSYYTEFVRAAVATSAHMGCLISDVGTLDGVVTAQSTGNPITATITALDGLSAITTTSDAGGYYTVTLPIDSYTVTAQAHLYGYFRTEVTQVNVLTDAVTHLDLELTPYPSYLVSGTVSDATTGSPLAATVATVRCPEGECHTNTQATVTSDVATGHYSATLISGTYSIRVEAEGYSPVVETLRVDGIQVKDFALYPRGCLLIVDDDGGQENQGVYQNDLEALGVGYATWEIDDRGTPPLSLLEQYGHVLWLTGRRFGETLVDADRTVLSQYMDGGGDLFVSSWGVGGDLADDAFLADYLHAAHNGDVVAGDVSLSGAGFMADHPLTVSSAIEYQISRLAPIGEAFAAYQLPDAYASPAAVAFAGDYQVLYLGFGLESVESDADRRAALSASLEWLGGCPVAVPEPSFISSSPDLVGSTTVFTNTTSSAPPIIYTWRFGDGTEPAQFPISQATITHTYTRTGEFTVWLTATNAGGEAAVSHTISITGTAPAAGFQRSASATVGAAVIFTNTTSLGQPDETSYTWDFGDGVGSSTSTHAIYTYTQVGTYTVWLTAANLAGWSTLSATIPVVSPRWHSFRIYVPLIIE